MSPKNPENFPKIGSSEVGRIRDLHVESMASSGQCTKRQERSHDNLLDTPSQERSHANLLDTPSQLHCGSKNWTTVIFSN